MTTNFTTPAEDQMQTLASRFAQLMADDPQFRDAAPYEPVTAAKTERGLRMAQIVATTMEGYADRPALGERVRELVTDPATGRRSLRLEPRFETITYRELWSRARAVAAEWHQNGQNPFSAGDFVCILGFTSTDYATLVLACIHLGAVVSRSKPAHPQNSRQRSSAKLSRASRPWASTISTLRSTPYCKAFRRHGWWCSTTTHESTTAGTHCPPRVSGWRTPTARSSSTSSPSSANRVRVCPRHRFTYPTSTTTHSRGSSTHPAAPARQRERC